MPTCPRCSSEVPEGAAACATCGMSLAEGAAGEAPSGDNPWKNRSSLGFGKALIETIKMIITNPAGFFGTLEKDGDWGSPILYAVIIGWISALFQFIYSFAINSAFSMPFMKGHEAMASMAMGTGIQIGVLIFAPVLVIIGSFIVAGLLHLACMVLGDGEKGFEVTFKAVAYSGTSSLAQIIPMCGSMIGGIWGLVLYIIGIKCGHRTDTWKAVVAPLLVMAVCCICIAVVIFMFGMSLAGMAGAAQGMK